MASPTSRLPAVIFAAGVIALWHFGTVVGKVPSYLLPGPADVWDAFQKHFGEISRALRTTSIAALAGFLGAALGGLLLALILASSRLVRSTIYPWVLLLQMTPVIVLAPMLTIWVGHGFGSVSLITFLVSFFPIVASTTHGLTSVDRNLTDLFLIGRATRRQELLLLRLPHAFPHYLTGLQIAATLAVIGAVTGETLAGSSESGGGVGFLVVSYYHDVRIPALCALALAACGLGLLFVGAVALLRRWLLRSWHPEFADKRGG
jgi:NitT/TauT family transport system permease protein